MPPLDVPIIVALDKLPGRFQGDPADRLIVATAKTHRLPLATRDLRIRASRTVPLWKPRGRAAGEFDGPRAVSKDGKVLTLSSKGTSATGVPYDNVMVYDKQ